MKKKRELVIGISVNGEGRGHVTRMTAIAQRLAERHTLVFWCPDSVRGMIRSHFPESVIYDIPYMEFVMNNFEVDYVRTTFRNIRKVVSAGFTISSLAEQLSDSKAEGIISDFEPFLPEAASRLGLPVLQLNHPGVVTRMRDYAPDALICRIVAARMMARFDREIICSFFEGDVGPILRKEVVEAKNSARLGDYFLVYAKEAIKPPLMEAIENLPALPMRVFPDPKSDYLGALAGCRAVIAPSGHQTLSEALYLRKPVFTVPIKNQYEQRLNAEMLRLSGWGEYAESDGIGEKLSRFIREADTYPRPPLDPSIRFILDDATGQAVAEIEAFFGSHERRSAGRRKYFRVSWISGKRTA